MKRSRRTLVGLAVAAVLLALGGVFGLPALRDAPIFRLSRVEVTGTRLLAPHQVLASARIAPDESVWDGPERWRAGVLRQRAVADVEVTRRFPGTLRLRVREKRPAALVEAGALRPVTAGGELLPLDPARIEMDLPLLRLRQAPAGERIADPDDRILLAEVGRLSRLDPALLADVSEIEPAGRGELLLRLITPALVVRLPAGVGAGRIAELRATLAELAGRSVGRDAAGFWLDLRYDEQIVVRPLPLPRV